MVKVRYSEGVAIHTDPESWAGHCREAVREALIGGRTGEVLSGESNLDQLADGRWKAMTQIHRRVMIKDFVGEADGYVADVEVLDEQPAPDVPDLILMKTKAYFIAHSFRDTIKQGYPRVPQIKPPFERIRDPGRLADMIAS